MPDAANAPTFEHLLGHRQFVRNLARQLVADADAARDVEQEVWLRALERPPRSVDRAGGWLRQVTRNLVRDRARTEATRRARETERGARALEDPGVDVSARSEVVEELARAFAALPEAYRHVLYLRYYEDRAPGEIAEALEAPLATVKTRLGRGLELLRRDLARRLDAEERNLAAWLVPIAAAERAERTGTSLVGGAVTSLALKSVAVLASAGSVTLAVWWGAHAAPSGDPEVRDTPRVAAASAGAPREPATPATASARRPRGATETGGGQESRRAPVSPAADVDSRPRIVYGATGQGVPYLELDLRVADDPAPTFVRIRTDAAGRFETERELDGELELRLAPDVELAREEPEELLERLQAMGYAIGIGGGSGGPLPTLDESAHVGAVRFTPDATETELTIPVALGPTYFVELERPEGYELSDFVARATEIGGMGHRQPGRTQPIHGGMPPWIRLPAPPERVFHRPSTWALDVISTDRRWAGSTELDWVRGVAEEPLALALEPHLMLTGRVLDENGIPLGGVLVELQRAEDARYASTYSTDDDGSYRLEMLDRGAHTLYVRDELHEPWKESVEVPAGVPRDIRLAARPAGGTIRGSVVSASGSYVGRGVEVLLTGEGDLCSWHGSFVRWSEEDGRAVGRFAFEDLPRGTYRFVVVTPDGVPVEERVRRVTPPAELDLWIDDGARAIPLRPTVVDAESGAPVEGYRFLYRFEGGALMEASSSLGISLDVIVREGLDFEWWILANGYRPFGGDETDVAPTGDFRASLVPGYGVSLHVASIEHMGGLGVVRVLASGETVGETSPHGHAVLSFDARPETLQFDASRWSVCTASTIEDPARASSGQVPTPEAGDLTVHLRPVVR